MDTPTIFIDLADDDADDLDSVHPLDCRCDDCIDGLIIELTQERGIA